MATQVVTVTRAITDGQGRAPIAVSTVVARFIQIEG